MNRLGGILIALAALAAALFVSTDAEIAVRQVFGPSQAQAQSGSTCPAHQWLFGFNYPSTKTCKQPQDSDIGGKIRTSTNTPVYYYVNPSTSVSAPCGVSGNLTCSPGNDGNDGLSPAKPFQHVSAASDAVSNSIIFSATPEIRLADGTYNENIDLRPIVGSYSRDSGSPLTQTNSQPTLRGNDNTPANVIISAPSGQDISMNGSYGGEWTITGLTLSSVGGATTGVLLDWSANMTVGNVVCSVSATCFNVRYGSRLEFLGLSTVTINHNMVNFIGASFNSTAIVHGTGGSGVNITLTGTPAFSGSFINADTTSSIDLTTANFSGSATGVKFFFGGDSYGITAQNIFTYPGSLAGIFTKRIPYGTFGNTIFVNGAGAPANCGAFVCQAGSDTSGDGFSIARPFATINKAVSWIEQNMDSVGLEIQIQVADTTYTAGFNAIQPMHGGGSLKLIGNTTTPANCLLNITGDAVAVGMGETLSIQGFRILATGNGLLAYKGGRITVSGKMEFGAGGTHINAQSGGVIDLASAYTISGGGNNHLSATFGGLIQEAAVATVTLTGSPVFAAAFAQTSDLGMIHITTNTTYSGAAGAVTTRFVANTNSDIDTGGAGANFFPGTAAGTTATGGQYN